MMEKAKHTHAAGETTAEQASMNNMDTLVGYILLIGVLVSVALIIAGTLWNWITAHSLTSLFTISGKNYFSFLASSLQQLFTGAIRPQLLISLGIVTLMFTPYLRVAASVVYFAFVARNLKYSIFTLFVFVVLTYSLFLR
jgi:uncharacterized membrane protein